MRGTVESGAAQSCQLFVSRKTTPSLYTSTFIPTCLSSLGKNVESFLLSLVGEQSPILYLEPSHGTVKHRHCESLEVRLWTVDRQDDVRVLV